MKTLVIQIYNNGDASFTFLPEQNTSWAMKSPIEPPKGKEFFIDPILIDIDDNEEHPEEIAKQIVIDTLTRLVSTSPPEPSQAPPVANP